MDIPDNHFADKMDTAPEWIPNDIVGKKILSTSTTEEKKKKTVFISIICRTNRKQCIMSVTGYT